MFSGMKQALFLFLVLCLLFSATNAGAQQDSVSTLPNCTVLENGNTKTYIFFKASADTTQTQSLTIFLHGYNGFQPEVYGGWINNLTEQGSIVVFPCYQSSVVDIPKYFYEHAVSEIHDALNELQRPDYPKADLSKAVYVGHSLGGSMIMALLNHTEENTVPKPYATLLAQPGSSYLRIAEEDDYNNLPENLLLVCFSGKSDLVTGDLFVKKVLTHTDSLNTAQKFCFELKDDKYGKPVLKSDHLVPCSYLDIVPEPHAMAKSVEIVSETDVWDWGMYWETSAILLEMMKNNSAPEAFKNQTNQILNMGKWPDGTPIDALELIPVESVTEK